MNADLKRHWTQEEFFAWAEKQNERYEFDGMQPVAMTRGSHASDTIENNIRGALRDRLRGGRCRSRGPNAGVKTVGDAVRYPDALITCSEQDMEGKFVTGPVVVFEVVSPSPIHEDHVEKPDEYMAVDSIRRYVIIESSTPKVTVIERKGAGEPLGMTLLKMDDILRIPEVGIEIPLAEIYEDVKFKEGPKKKP